MASTLLRQKSGEYEYFLEAIFEIASYLANRFFISVNEPVKILVQRYGYFDPFVTADGEIIFYIFMSGLDISIKYDFNAPYDLVGLPGPYTNIKTNGNDGSKRVIFQFLKLTFRRHESLR